MRYGGGDVVLVPADTFVFDCVLEAVFVVIETRGTGFHFDEDDFLDVLRVHAFEDQEVDRRADEFRLGGAEGEVWEVRRELLGEHAAQYRARALQSHSLCFGKFNRRSLLSDQFAKLVHEKERCGDEQCESGNRDRR